MQQQPNQNSEQNNSDGFTLVGKNNKTAKPAKGAMQSKNQPTNQRNASHTIRYERFDPQTASLSLMADANNPHMKRSVYHADPWVKPSKGKENHSENGRIDIIEDKLELLISLVETLANGNSERAPNRQNAYGF